MVELNKVYERENKKCRLTLEPILGASTIVDTNTGLGWSTLHYRFVIVLCGIPESVSKHKMLQPRM